MTTKPETTPKSEIPGAAVSDRLDLDEIRRDREEGVPGPRRLNSRATYIDQAHEIERLRARIAELEAVAAYIAGTNDDPVHVALAGNPNVCGHIVDRARALLKGAEE